MSIEKELKELAAQVGLLAAAVSAGAKDIHDTIDAAEAGGAAIGGGAPAEEAPKAKPKRAKKPAVKEEAPSADYAALKDEAKKLLIKVKNDISKAKANAVTETVMGEKGKMFRDVPDDKMAEVIKLATSALKDAA